MSIIITCPPSNLELLSSVRNCLWLTLAGAMYLLHKSGIYRGSYGWSATFYIPSLQIYSHMCELAHITSNNIVKALPPKKIPFNTPLSKCFWFLSRWIFFFLARRTVLIIHVFLKTYLTILPVPFLYRINGIVAQMKNGSIVLNVNDFFVFWILWSSKLRLPSRLDTSTSDHLDMCQSFWKVESL